MDTYEAKKILADSLRCLARSMDQIRLRELEKVSGMSRGRVKRKEYLKYLVGVREGEMIARQIGLTIKTKSIEEIRMDFEKEFGSIYY